MIYRGAYENRPVAMVYKSELAKVVRMLGNDKTDVQAMERLASLFRGMQPATSRLRVSIRGAQGRAQMYVSSKNITGTWDQALRIAVLPKDKFGKLVVLYDNSKNFSGFFSNARLPQDSAHVSQHITDALINVADNANIGLELTTEKNAFAKFRALIDVPFAHGV